MPPKKRQKEVENQNPPANPNKEEKAEKQEDKANAVVEAPKAVG
jgi:hypothetical protein